MYFLHAFQHLPDGYPKDFPLPSGHTDMLDVYVEYHADGTTVQLRVEPFTIHLPTLVSLFTLLVIMLACVWKV